MLEIRTYQFLKSCKAFLAKANKCRERYKIALKKGLLSFPVTQLAKVGAFEVVFSQKGMTGSFWV